MKKIFVLGSVLLAAMTSLAADVQTSENQVTIRPDGGQAKVIRLEVMNGNIIRVRATSKDVLPQKPASLMIVPQTAPPRGSYSSTMPRERSCLRKRRTVSSSRTSPCLSVNTASRAVHPSPRR